MDFVTADRLDYSDPREGSSVSSPPESQWQFLEGNRPMNDCGHWDVRGSVSPEIQQEQGNVTADANNLVPWGRVGEGRARQPSVCGQRSASVWKSTLRVVVVTWDTPGLSHLGIPLGKWLWPGYDTLAMRSQGFLASGSRILRSEKYVFMLPALGMTHKWNNVERSDRTRGVSHLHQQLWACQGS